MTIAPRALPFVCLVLLVGGAAAAQTTGSIEGRVLDATAAPLPGITVEATSSNLQGIRATSSGPDGSYRIPAVPPGEYRVRVSLSGFRTAEKTATVRLDATATADFTLEPAATEEVIVSGTAPLIDKTSTTTGTNYTSKVIGYLPTARNYADIVRSNPGVSTDRGQTQGRSLTLSIYGATSAENQWIIDGVNTTNTYIGVQGKAINNEFVQEVEVKTGGYQAEYGRALGGVVNVITKSGGNEFHGDGFVYYDSTGTAAAKQFKPGDSGRTDMRVADGERFDYGVDIGGYLIKDRLWFFGAYNRVSLSTELSRLEASKYVSTEDRFPLDAKDNLYSGKLTWNLAMGTTIVGTVFADSSTDSGAAGADPRQGLGAFEVTPPVNPDPSTWSSERFQGGTDFGLRVTQLFGSRALATIQGSYHKDRNGLTPPEGIRYIDETCEGGTPDDRCAFPLEPFVTGGYGFVFGRLDNNTSKRWQFVAGMTFYAGDHELKLGGDYQDGSSNVLYYWTGDQVVRIRNEFGQPYYAHRFFVANTDDPDPTPIPSVFDSATVLDYGVYLQDSWKMSPGLTLNLGLRWDGETSKDYTGQTVLRLNDQWQPRIGVVWDPWQDGATKIYAFAGRFSYALPTVAVASSFGFNSELETYNFDPVDVTQSPDVINHEDIDVRATGTYGDAVDPGVRGWYQDELTAGVERLITPTLTIGLKGTYRTLRNVLEDRCDLDYNSPETDYSGCGLMNPGSDAPIASGNIPTCNQLDDPYYECGIEPAPATPNVSRIYRGIELIARQQIGNSLWLQASYVHSSLRGNYDGGVNQGAFGQTAPGINVDFDLPPTWRNGYGALALDRPNRFRFDGYWNSPWRVSVGLQAFAESGGALNRKGYFSEGWGTLVFLDPRGSSGRLPTYWGANLSLAYPITLGPATVTLQAYLFNVFDKQIAIARDEDWSIEQQEGYPLTIYDPNQRQSNPEYGYVTARSDPRFFRAAVKISF